jgi:hypothetical protein
LYQTSTERQADAAAQAVALAGRKMIHSICVHGDSDGAVAIAAAGDPSLSLKPARFTLASWHLLNVCKPARLCYKCCSHYEIDVLPQQTPKNQKHAKCMSMSVASNVDRFVTFPLWSTNYNGWGAF